jgi:uncharacterized protein YciW
VYDFVQTRPETGSAARAQFLDVIRTTSSSLTIAERLLAAFTVSRVNGATTDAETLRDECTELGIPLSLLANIERVAGRWSVCDDERLAVVVDYAARLTRVPGAVGPEDLRRLRAVALTDIDIFVLNNIVGAYNYLNRARAGLPE